LETESVGSNLGSATLSWANGLSSQSTSALIFKAGIIIILSAHLHQKLLEDQIQSSVKAIYKLYILVK